MTSRKVPRRESLESVQRPQNSSGASVEGCGCCAHKVVYCHVPIQIDVSSYARADGRRNHCPNAPALGVHCKEFDLALRGGGHEEHEHFATARSDRQFQRISINTDRADFFRIRVDDQDSGRRGHVYLLARTDDRSRHNAKRSHDGRSTIQVHSVSSLRADSGLAATELAYSSYRPDDYQTRPERIHLPCTCLESGNWPKNTPPIADMRHYGDVTTHGPHSSVVLGRVHMEAR